MSASGSPSRPGTSQPPHTSPPAWHDRFLKLLPAIREQARFRFRSTPVEPREDLIQEVIANAPVAYVRLADLDKENLAYAGPLAGYAVAQVREGRRVGSSLDILVPYYQRKKNVHVERIDRYDEQEDEWQEIIIEDRHCGPAEIAVTRIDFQTWLKFLPPRESRIAQRLALGESTSRVARLFKVSAGRVSQIRRELHEAWLEFQSELQPAATA